MPPEPIMPHSDPNGPLADFALSSVLQQRILGFAGSFASWFLYVPARILFDAGEGITSRLRNRVFLPEAVFLTHAHLDHISGLHAFLSARNSMRGDNNKPLTVYFPDGAQAALQPLWQYIDALLPEGSNRPVWKPLQTGDRIPARNWTVEAFATRHGVPSLGYRILEARTRLKSEFERCLPDEIRQLRQSGTVVKENAEHVLFAFTGDTGPGLDTALFQKADVLFHESTFLNPADREGLLHSTMAEAFDLAAQADVRQLVLYHFSQRYTAAEIRHAIDTLREASGFKGQLACVAGFTEPPEWY